MKAAEHAKKVDSVSAAPLVSKHWVGLRGRLSQPFWGWLGGWAVLCGALASNQLSWGKVLPTLALTLLLVELAWSSLWDLTVSTGWPRPPSRGRPPEHPARLSILPYTSPNSPAGRLSHFLGLALGWWRETLWPTAGPALLGLLASLALTATLALLLPERLRLLHVAFAALIGLAMIRKRRAREPLAAHALARIGLPWLAGHSVYSNLGPDSVIMVLAFALAGWGNLRVSGKLRGGLWLLNGGQAIVIALLLSAQQPLAAGLVGLLLLGQVALQPSLRYGASAAHEIASKRAWPWLMLAMLVAAWALP